MRTGRRPPSSDIRDRWVPRKPQVYFWTQIANRAIIKWLVKLAKARSFGGGSANGHSRMFEFLNSTTAQIVLGFAGLAVVSAVGFYVIAKVRNEWIESTSDTSDLITNFRDLKESGQLSDKEYRTIKGMLAEKLSRELNDSDEAR